MSFVHVVVLWWSNEVTSRSVSRSSTRDLNASVTSGSRNDLQQILHRNTHKVHLNVGFSGDFLDVSEAVDIGQDLWGTHTGTSVRCHLTHERILLHASG